MKSFKVKRDTPQAAAATFLEAYVENSDRLFEDLQTGLEKLPKVGTSSFRYAKTEIWLNCRPNVGRLGRNEDGAGIRAIERAIQVWVTAAFASEDKKLEGLATKINVTMQSGGQQFKVDIEAQLF